MIFWIKIFIIEMILFAIVTLVSYKYKYPRHFFISINILTIQLLSILFSYTKGLMIGTIYVTELNGGISNDNVIIESSVIVFIFPMILSMLLFKRKKLNFLLYALILISGFFQTIFFVSVIIFDGCSLIDTIFIGKNIILSLYIFTLFIYFIIIFYSCFKDFWQYRSQK